MPWIHAAAALLLTLGTVTLFAFLRWVDQLDSAEFAIPTATACVALSSPSPAAGALPAPALARRDLRAAGDTAPPGARGGAAFTLLRHAA